MIDLLLRGGDVVDGTGAARVRAAAARNGIGHLRVHECALGEADGTATLSVPAANTGEATLTDLPSDVVSSAVAVPVRRGDALLAAGFRDGYKGPILR